MITPPVASVVTPIGPVVANVGPSVAATEPISLVVVAGALFTVAAVARARRRRESQR